MTKATTTMPFEGRSPRSSAHQPEKLAGPKLATRLAFFIAGFAIACWAPLVPYAQQRLNADAATLGSVLLCLGLGAVIGMPLAGSLSARLGNRFIIVAGAIGLMASLPLLTSATTPMTLGASLLLFGVALGCIDVAANIHGNDVQDAAGVPLMSGFHGWYSVGGLLGALGMTGVLASGTPALLAAALASVVVLVCAVSAASRFLPKKALTSSHPLIVVPRGVVIVIGLLTLICFMSEGAMLDWSALLLTQFKGVEVTMSGSAYALFAFTMTAARLVGDRAVAIVGEKRLLLAGFIVTAFGLAVIALSGSLPLLYAGTAIAGLAVGNVVPILFTMAGRQRAMPANLAIAAASTLGYLGILAGPALIGFAAHFIGLVMAFVAVAAMLLASSLVIPAVQRSVP